MSKVLIVFFVKWLNISYIIWINNNLIPVPNKLFEITLMTWFMYYTIIVAFNLIICIVGNYFNNMICKFWRLHIYLNCMLICRGNWYRVDLILK